MKNSLFFIENKPYTNYKVTKITLNYITEDSVILEDIREYCRRNDLTKKSCRNIPTTNCDFFQVYVIGIVLDIGISIFVMYSFSFWVKDIPVIAVSSESPIIM